jgi:hypothetical protein
MIITIESAVSAMRDCVLSRRKSLFREMAIGLAVLAGEGLADKNAKKILISVYAEAGNDCTERSGADYSLVHNRVAAVACMFGSIGLEKIMQMIGKKRGETAIIALSNHVESMGCFSISAIQDLCGTRSELEKENDRHEVLSPVGQEIHFKTAHMKLDIPPETTVDEVELMVKKLIRLANKLRKEFPI